MISFGILGAGNIAHRFKKAVDITEGARVTAVASKDKYRAQTWAEEEDIEIFYGNYEEMLQNPSIDAVYIATTNNFHYENILLCLNAGKHVLCEKPLALTYAHAERVCSLARQKALFLMEGMWTRFLPKSQVIRSWIQNDKIGAVKLMQATIGWVADKTDNRRLFLPELGGGSLYDLGVYPLELLPYYANQKILQVQSLIYPYNTGVDDLLSLNLVLEHSFANIQCSFTTKLPEDAYIYGEKGYIHIPKIHFGNSAYLYNLNDKLMESFESEEENGFRYEIEEVIRCIKANKLESAICPHSMTLETCALYDQILSL